MKPQEPQEPREADRLVARGGEPAELILRGVRALDPRAGIDDHVDLVIRGGEVAELAQPGSADTDGAEVVEAEGLHAFPAFFDPHVHLRTPGREDEEDLETGTRSAAAGGYWGILAMANTAPTVSTPADIESLRERATRDAAIPVGFLSVA